MCRLVRCTVRRATRCMRDADAGLARAAKALFFLVQHVVAPYFFFVSLIVDLLVRVADALALVGLGRANARTSAATWPTAWRSHP